MDGAGARGQGPGARGQGAGARGQGPGARGGGAGQGDECLDHVLPDQRDARWILACHGDVAGETSLTLQLRREHAAEVAEVSLDTRVPAMGY